MIDVQEQSSTAAPTVATESITSPPRSRLRAAVIGSVSEVGPAVMLCSWTSIIGYGSLLFSLNRALRSFGWYAMAGEVTTILTAVILLPALLALARPREPEAESIVRRRSAAGAP